jgi:tRNA (cytidine32/guanosine34-2'-O)-methyltransferase
MASSDRREIAYPPSTFRSAVWQHFGYPIEEKDGNRVVAKTRTICRKCFKTLPQVMGNTSNMQMHMQRHHPEISLSGAKKLPQQQQSTLTNIFEKKLPINSDRAQKIKRAIGLFMALDMRPFSVVENEGFRNLLHLLEPRYEMPSRAHFSENVLLG